MNPCTITEEVWNFFMQSVIEKVENMILKLVPENNSVNSIFT